METRKNAETIAVVRERERERELCLGGTGLKFGAQNLKKYIDKNRGWTMEEVVCPFCAHLRNKGSGANEKKKVHNLKDKKRVKVSANKWKEFLKARGKEYVTRQKNENHFLSNSERGVTLISLVITILLLIILASVTISVVFNEGGLADQSKHAAEEMQNAEKQEQQQLDDVASRVNEIIAGIGSGNTGETNTIPGEDTNSVEDTNTIDPEPVPDPLPDGTISIGQPDWQEDGTANVTVSTTEPDVTIEYQIDRTDEDSWIPVEDGVIEGIENGETVYVRITDGEQSSNPQETTVQDTTAPGKANIEVNPTSLIVGENLTATVTHIDNETGIDTSASKWVMNQSATEIGTGEDAISQYTGSFAANPDTITLDSSNAGVYYLHVLTTDIAGNKTETVSSAITISAITGTVSQNGSISWNAGQATLVLQTTESQYTIVYKINGQRDWQTYNGTSITGLSHGDTVTACLTNARQTTYGPEAEFEIQDTVDPTVTVTAQGSPSTNSITVTAQAVDNESGMKTEPTYTFQYKTRGAGSYTTPDGASNISSAQYTFTGLTQGTTYDIQVIVNGDVAGRSGTGTTQATTDTVPGADAGLQTGTIIASPATWSNYKASTTLTTNETNFQIQYQVGGPVEASWSEPADSPVTVSNLDHGSTVYARLTDGTNVGGYASITILDGIEPTVSVTVNEVTDSTIKVTVTATDKESGLASSNAYRYYINSESSPRGTSSSNTYTYEGLTASTPYNIKVEVVDKGNNTGTGTASTQTTAPPISEMESFVGYYADVDGDGSADGIIYADLATGGSGQWGDSNGEYTIPISNNFKKYSVIGTYNSSGFGTEDVIRVSNNAGNERFYVMALSDVSSSTYQFWGVSGTSRVTSSAFGEGEANTAAMLGKSESSNYLWGQISSQIAEGWYVPSKCEWAAFADAFDITRSNYSNTYGLSDSYWTSSQINETNVYITYFRYGYMYAYIMTYERYPVRLGTTF